MTEWIRGSSMSWTEKHDKDLYLTVTINIVVMELIFGGSLQDSGNWYYAVTSVYSPSDRSKQTVYERKFVLKNQ